ncbi:MAG: PQQ-like beta-propeller repeat protein, partial [Pseudomonadales bacterium]|nr:PQQ-like beta-propeller repeat protein [Pseudomonadales bacterium]
TMYRHNDNEIIIGLDANTGETRWEYSYEAPLAHDGYFDIWLNAAGPGPYSSPLIADGIVYAVGVNGHFHAVDAQTGALRWSHNLVELFGLVDYNAFASSAVAYDGAVILPMGGSDHGVVAFDGETGAVVWESASFPLGPGSPRVIQLNGQDQLVVWGQQEVVGLDPRDGGRLWHQPHANDLGLNLSMPVWSTQQRLFISSAYNGGSRMIQLQSDRTGTTVQELWHTNRTRLHFSNAIEIGNLVIGSSGDFGPAFLTALNATTGEEVWRERSFARAHLLYADDVMILVDEDGELAIASVSADGIEVHARTALLEENAWTPPSLVGSTLYVRDRHEIMALDLGE